MTDKEKLIEALKNCVEYFERSGMTYLFVYRHARQTIEEHEAD